MTREEPGTTLTPARLLPHAGRVVHHAEGGVAASLRSLTLVGGKGARAPRVRTGSCQLTHKQKAFCRYYVGETNGIGIEAYRLAYPNFRGTDKTAAEKASRLKTTGKIWARIEELEEAEWARVSHLDLSDAEFVRERLRHEAVTANTDSGRMRALELLGKLSDVQVRTPEQ